MRLSILWYQCPLRTTCVLIKNTTPTSFAIGKKPRRKPLAVTKLGIKKAPKKIACEYAAEYFQKRDTRTIEKRNKTYDTETKKLIRKRSTFHERNVWRRYIRSFAGALFLSGEWDIYSIIYIDFPSVNSRINTRQTDGPIYSRSRCPPTFVCFVNIKSAKCSMYISQARTFRWQLYRNFYTCSTFIQESMQFRTT